MKKYIVATAVLALLLIGGFFIWQGYTPSTSMPSTANTSFNASTIKVGDTVGSFKVVAVGPYNNIHQVSPNIQIRFTGSATVEGTLSDLRSERPEIGLLIDFSDVSAALLPHQEEGYIKVFRITNPEIVPQTLHDGDKVEVVINEYTYISYPADLSDTAKVVSIRKLGN